MSALPSGKFLMSNFAGYIMYITLSSALLFICPYVPSIRALIIPILLLPHVLFPSILPSTTFFNSLSPLRIYPILLFFFLLFIYGNGLNFNFYNYLCQWFQFQIFYIYLCQWFQFQIFYIYLCQWSQFQLFLFSLQLHLFICFHVLPLDSFNYFPRLQRSLCSGQCIVIHWDASAALVCN